MFGPADRPVASRHPSQEGNLVRTFHCNLSNNGTRFKEGPEDRPETLKVSRCSPDSLATAPPFWAKTDPRTQG